MKNNLRSAVMAVGLASGTMGLLSGCVTSPSAENMSVRPVSWNTLAGVGQEDWASVLPVLDKQCAHLASLPANAALGGAASLPQGHIRADWNGACEALPSAGASSAEVLGYFERWFQPYELTAPAFLTGYYEPQVEASRSRFGAYQVPVYRRPPDLQRAKLTNGQTVFGRWQNGTFTPYDSRARIDGGTLAGKNLELAWVKDPVDLFFLQVQGSGRLVMPDGETMRIGYDGQNGQPYVPIGRVLEQKGALTREAVNADAIRAWLAAHPQDVQGVLESNPSYVFFRPLPESSSPERSAKVGPPGAFGVALTPGRSMAVDRKALPFGAPVWVETQVPDARTGQVGAWQHLVFAQDTGTDIRGPGRGDLFMGGGRNAPWVAGHLRSRGRMIVLVPNAGLPR